MERPILILDADTIRLPDRRSVRLAGLDAPELGQLAIDSRGRRYDAGLAASRALLDHLEAKVAEGFVARVVGDAQDKYGRILGSITLDHPDGRAEDVGAWLVQSGLAVAEYGERYRTDEAEARAAGIGMWGGRLAYRPQAWRRRGARAHPMIDRRTGRPGCLVILVALTVLVVTLIAL